MSMYFIVILYEKPTQLMNKEAEFKLGQSFTIVQVKNVPPF